MKRSRGRQKGFKVSDESKRKCSKTMKGRPLTIKHRKNIGKGMVGNTNASDRGNYPREAVTSGLLQAHPNMLHRCYNPDDKQFKDYGLRNIYVCEEWKHNCERFYSDILKHIGPRPCKGATLDRTDNDDIYRIENMRWADRTVQALNRRICGREPFTESIFYVEKSREFLIVVTNNHYCRCVARCEFEDEAREVFEYFRKEK